MTTSREDLLVVSWDYRIADPQRVPPFLQRHADRMAVLGCRHVLVYISNDDAKRVLVLLIMYSREPVTELLRARTFLDWFDAVGVSDIPAVFAGRLRHPGDTGGLAGVYPAPHIVARIGVLSDVDAFVSALRSCEPAAGAAHDWIFQALDNPHEVLVFHEATEDNAAAAGSNPFEQKGWSDRAGRGAYPPTFFGRLALNASIPPPDGADSH